MRGVLLVSAAALFACSGRLETFSVSPDQKHVFIGYRDSFRIVDVDTMAEVGHASDVYASLVAFSVDGSMAVLRGTHGNLVTVPTAGGAAVDFGPALEFGKISPDGSRVAFLRNARACPDGRQSGCSELYSAPSTGGEAVRVASGIRVSISNDPALVVPASLMDEYRFAGNDTLVFTTFEGNLMWAPADGSAEAALLAPGTPSRFQFLPPVPPGFSSFFDGRVIVNDGTGLVLMDPHGGAPVRLAEGGTTSLLCAPSSVLTVDPSCKPSAAGMLASYSQGVQTSTVQTIPLTGGTSFTVSAVPYSLYFDPVGNLVFYDAGGFLTVASPSGEIRQVGKPAIGGYRFAVAPDGSWQSFLEPWLNAAGPCVNCDILHLVSVATAAAWTLTAGGRKILIVAHAFSPDSTSILFRTHDRELGVVPVGGGEPRFLQSDVDDAGWAGSDHVVMNRTRSSPAGVQILRVR